jgi:hypothetical protein
VLGFPTVPFLRVTWDELLETTPFGGLAGLDWALRWFGFRWIIQDGRASGLFTDFPIRTPTIQPGSDLVSYDASRAQVKARSDGTPAPPFADFPVEP